MLGIVLLLGAGPAQARSAPGDTQTAQVLLVSDIHFDPFWDPGKVEKLAAAPIEQWSAILASPDSPDRPQRAADLERTCHLRGQDTTYPLLRSSLAAMRSRAAGPSFVVLSGDLVAHAFGCQFHAVLPNARPTDYPVFVEKTMQFVLLKLRSAFPGKPVFAAMGNNDTDCGDYQIDAHSAFLRALAPAMTEDIHGPEHEAALSSFAAEGDYSAALPAPFRRTRLLVLDDLFASAKYASCAGKAAPQAGRAQIAWLLRQLQAARRKRLQVWVVGHIPPGIDPYSTALKSPRLCAGQPPVVFLGSNALASTLQDFGGVVRLAVFGHTHMDEIRLLSPGSSARSGSAVAVKVIPSISPVDGNRPSFVVAQADPASAALKDYQVIAASNKTGFATRWGEEYDFGRQYHESAFDAASVARLIRTFAADRFAAASASQSYIQDFYIGAPASELKPFWPQYVCALANTSAGAYRSCACNTGPAISGLPRSRP